MLLTRSFEKALKSPNPIVIGGHRAGKSTLALHIHKMMAESGKKWIIADEPSETAINDLLKEFYGDDSVYLKIFVRRYNANLLDKLAVREMNHCSTIRWSKQDLCAAALHIEGIEDCYNQDNQRRYIPDKLWRNIVDSKDFIDPGLLHEAAFVMKSEMAVRLVGLRRIEQLRSLRIRLPDNVFKGLMLPCPVREIEERLSDCGIDMLQRLEEAGVVTRLKTKESIDMTEVFRLVFGCGRKGGIIGPRN